MGIFETFAIFDPFEKDPRIKIGPLPEINPWKITLVMPENKRNSQ